MYLNKYNGIIAVLFVSTCEKKKCNYKMINKQISKGLIYIEVMSHCLDADTLFFSYKGMGRTGLGGSMDGHLDMSHLQVPKRVGSPQDEPNDLEELEQFAKAFKQRRIKLGFTQVKALDSI